VTTEEAILVYALAGQCDQARQANLGEEEDCERNAHKDSWQHLANILPVNRYQLSYELCKMNSERIIEARQGFAYVLSHRSQGWDTARSSCWRAKVLGRCRTPLPTGRSGIPWRRHHHQYPSCAAPPISKTPQKKDRSANAFSPNCSMNVIAIGALDSRLRVCRTHPPRRDRNAQWRLYANKTRMKLVE